MTPLPDARVLVAVLMLIGASGLDWRMRRVPNLYWFPFVVADVVLVAGDIAHAVASRQFGAALPYAIALLASGISYLLFRFGAFGGADAKALMILAFMMPFSYGLVPIVPVMGALMISSLLVAATPLVMVAVNLARGDVAWPGMLLGFRMDIRTARRAHVWPIQEFNGSKLAWRIRRRIDMDTDAAYDAIEAAGHSRVWTTPKVPYLIPLTAGVALWPTVAGWLDTLAGVAP